MPNDFDDVFDFDNESIDEYITAEILNPDETRDIAPHPAATGIVLDSSRNIYPYIERRATDPATRSNPSPRAKFKTKVYKPLKLSMKSRGVSALAIVKNGVLYIFK